MFGWELPPYNSGGLGTACLGLTEGLAPLGVDITFVVPKLFGKLPYNHIDVVSADSVSDDEVSHFLKLSDVEKAFIEHALAYNTNLSIDEKKRLWIKQMGTASVPVSPKIQATWYAFQARAIAEKSNFELIHTHDWMTYYGGIAAKNVARRRGQEIPLLAQIHATEIDRCGMNGDPGIVEIERRGLHAADRVIAVSHYTKEVVHKHYGVPKSKISVVHNGIPDHKQPKMYDLHELKKHHKIVLFMGRVTMQKGPDYFVKLAKAVTDIDPSVRFIMAGSGDMEKRMIEESARMGLTGKMLFSSFLRGEDVDRAYQLADLFVMCSVSEPFGIVALESIQNGTPVLVSNQSGVAEVSDHLIKVDFWDINKMRDEVLHVLHNGDFHAHLKHGGARDLERLTWRHAAANLKQVYENILGEPQFALAPVADQLYL